MKRSSGVLLHISSLPSPYGIGNLGQAARDFVDFLAKAGQSWWQILPTTPTGYGDSPYQSASTFAGNPYFIDPDRLVEEGLLTPEELDLDWGSDESCTDYGRLYEQRLPVLRKAFDRAKPSPELDAFCRENSQWLDDYALFMAVKASFGGAPWLAWDADIRLRRPQALNRYSRELDEEIRFHKWLQYLFSVQWKALRAYAAQKGIQIIGDIPIYVPMDSADVWSAPENFQLGRTRQPRVVAGCPPDAFNRTGQYWGNPIYDWENMKADGFSWWLRRLDAAISQFDMVRIDHFRGIESYWSIPARHKTARYGKWVPGPGMALIDAARQAFPNGSFIAEDLGFLTPQVHELVRQSGFPGMKVLQFAFDGQDTNPYLPHTYGENCVCYTGTHDNPPLRGWYEDAKKTDLDRDFAAKYMGLAQGEDFCNAVIRLGMESNAQLFICQMQDYLELGSVARMNEPGVRKPQNWCWRMKPGAADDALAGKIASLTKSSGRC